MNGACMAGSPVTCDDNLACTTDKCSPISSNSYQCDHKTVSGTCFIDGQCYTSGKSNPNNPCQVCAPDKSMTDWSSAGAGLPCDDGYECTTDACNESGDCAGTINANHCLIQGTCYTKFETNPLNECTMCNPSFSQTQWFESLAACGVCQQGIPCSGGLDCGPDGDCFQGQCFCF